MHKCNIVAALVDPHHNSVIITIHKTTVHSQVSTTNTQIADVIIILPVQPSKQAFEYFAESFTSPKDRVP